jgi:hypothetical protein
MLSIQQADQIARQVADEFGVPPPPPLYVTSKLPSQYAGAYYHNGEQHIKIRPEYFTERTVAHEVGHYVFHTRAPGVCQGQNPECEELAQMIERWWVDKRRRERTLINGRARDSLGVTFKLNRPLTLREAQAIADKLSESPHAEAIERVGFKGNRFYVVLKKTPNVDGFVWALLIPVVVGALSFVGVIVQWYTIGSIAGALLAPGPLGLPVVVWIIVAIGAALIPYAYIKSRK